MAQIDSETSRSSAVTVYLMAENRLLREALVHVFQRRAAISVVGQCRSSEPIVAQITASQCDVLLSDSLTTDRTTSVIEELCETAPQIKTVLFGMNEDADDFLRAVRSGVCGYLLKDASAAEIIAAVRAVALGEAVCPPRLCMTLFQLTAQQYREGLGPSSQQPSARLGLTHRQRQLAALVARGMTNKEIAASLNLSEFTVKNHMHRIMKQVNAESRHEAVDLIRAGGCLPVA